MVTVSQLGPATQFAGRQYGNTAIQLAGNTARVGLAGCQEVIAALLLYLLPAFCVDIVVHGCTHKKKCLALNVRGPA